MRIQYVCRCPPVWIGPHEDESVSVMRLEKKSSIHNLNVFAMHHGKSSPVFFLIYVNKSLHFGRLMSLVCSPVCETHFPTVH